MLGFDKVGRNAQMDWQLFHKVSVASDGNEEPLGWVAGEPCYGPFKTRNDV